MKKIMSILLTLAMICTFAVIPVSAETDTWDGTTVATAYAGGTGSEKDPYLISTCAQLLYLRDQVNAGTTYAGSYFKLTNDLDFGSVDVKTPIGQYKSGGNKYFSGTFDGAGHVIKNFKVVSFNDRYLGLFGAVSGATIKNLGMTGAYIRCTSETDAVVEIGGIVGYGVSSSVISNCFVRNSSIIAKATKSGSAIKIKTAGSIAGEFNGTIENCYAVKNTVKTEKSGGIASNGAGGIAGRTKGTVKNCYSAEITFTNISYNKYAVSRNNSCTAENNFTTVSKNGSNETATNSVAVDELKALPAGLNSTGAYVPDINNINNGYPVLKVETPNVYIITTNAPEAGGTLSAPAGAVAGETVTLTVTPDEFYAVESVIVDGVAIDAVDGVYSFTMPEKNITVEASFKVTATKNTITVTQPVGAVLSVAETEAYTGEVITIGVTTELGYGVSGIYVNGQEITAVNGVYSFEMPDTDADITAVVVQKFVALQPSLGKYVYPIKAGIEPNTFTNVEATEEDGFTKVVPLTGSEIYFNLGGGEDTFYKGTMEIDFMLKDLLSAGEENFRIRLRDNVSGKNNYSNSNYSYLRAVSNSNGGFDINVTNSGTTILGTVANLDANTEYHIVWDYDLAAGKTRLTVKDENGVVGTTQALDIKTFDSKKNSDFKGMSYTVSLGNTVYVKNAKITTEAFDIADVEVSASLDSVTANASFLRNRRAAGATPMVIVAVYDGDILVGANIANESLEEDSFTYYGARKTVNLTAALSIADLDAGEYQVKAFVWAPSLVPYTEIVDASLVID